MPTNYLPGRYTIPAAVTGDTFAGIPSLTVAINGAAPSVALASVRMQFRTSATASTASLELTSGDGDITIVDADYWEITVEPFNLSLAAGVWYYDIEFTDAGGDVKTYVTGTWSVAQDVTRT